MDKSKPADRKISIIGYILLGIASTILIANALYLGFSSLVIAVQIFQISMPIGIVYVLTGIVPILLALPALVSGTSTQFLFEFAKYGNIWESVGKILLTFLGALLGSWLLQFLVGYCVGLLTSAVLSFL